MNAFFVTTLLVLFVTHFIGGIAAFGSTLLALPLLLLLGWELQTAVVLLLIAGSVQALTMAALTWRGADRRKLRRIFLLAGAGLPVGLAIAEWLPRTALQCVLGALLILAGTSHVVEKSLKTQWCLPRWLLDALLVAGGIVHGAFGVGGATLTIYARYDLPTKEAFRGTLSVTLLVLNLFAIGGLAAKGHAGGGVLMPAVLGGIVIFMATILGNRLVARISQQSFRDLVSGLLIIAGLTTVARTMMG